MLLDDIIQILGDEKGSLSEALLKTKIFLHQIGKKELTDWINSELNGYSNDDVPAYRVVPSEVMANLTSIAMRATSHPIPIGHLTQEQQENLTQSKMKQSIAIIEDFGKKNDRLIRRLPMELNFMLGKGLAEGIYVESAWCESNLPAVKNILVQVRSRLLDFLLELKDSFGGVHEEAELKKRASSIDADSMFKNAIFGPNTTIVVGHGNVQKVENQNVAGNMEVLKRVLAEAGVPEEELKSLEAAIVEDKKSNVLAPFEGKTGAWYTGLLGRAAKGGLKVGVDVLSSAVAKAIAAYYGFGS